MIKVDVESLRVSMTTFFLLFFKVSSLSLIEVSRALLEEEMTNMSMGTSEISQFYVGKNVFVTGATGWLCVILLVS